MIKNNLRVLIVEDNEDMKDILAFQIEHITGSRPSMASDAPEALSLVEAANIEEFPFSLILMDLRLPVIGGLEAAMLLRKTGFKGVIAACTADASESGKEESEKAGINVYFDKKALDKKALEKLLEMV